MWCKDETVVNNTIVVNNTTVVKSNSKEWSCYVKVFKKNSL